MTEQFQPPPGPPPGQYGPPTGHPPQQYAGQRPPLSKGAVLGFIFAFLFWPLGVVGSLIGLAHTKPGMKRGRGLAVAGLVIEGLALVGGIIIVVVAVAVGGGSSTTSNAADPISSATATSDAPTSTAPMTEAPTPTPPPSTAAPTTPAPAPTTQAPAAPAETISQEQALRSAKQYLSFQAFSYKGLIQQLSSSAGDGFSQADATYAADHCGADWNAEAAQAAKEYLKLQSFSHAGLVQQLDSQYGDQYTPAQAEYGVEQAGL